MHQSEVITSGSDCMQQFRDAYQKVGGLVKSCLQEGVLLRDLSLDQWKKHHPFFQEDIFERLAPKQVVASRLSEGGTAFERVKEQIFLWQKRLNLQKK